MKKSLGYSDLSNKIGVEINVELGKFLKKNKKNSSLIRQFRVIFSGTPT